MPVSKTRKTTTQTKSKSTSQRSRRRTHRSTSSRSTPTWSDETELIGLRFNLVALQNSDLYAQYSIGLHAWFLDQIRQTDPALSRQLHDDSSEKAFTISGLDGAFVPSGQHLRLTQDQTYRWTVTALSKPVVQWLQRWLESMPEVLELRDAPLKIAQVEIANEPLTYAQLAKLQPPTKFSIALSFLSPTSFRSKGRHLPLPIPRNIFHSYLRRWNDLSGQTPVDQDEFLDWLDEYIIIQRHHLRSLKVAAGKRGSVTGFTGAIEFGLTASAQKHPEFVQLAYTLVHLAPYCGTGHKTTFGLGQTQLGWSSPEKTDELALDPATQTAQLLAQRIEDLTNRFIAQRKRKGGDRAQAIAETHATILARREFGESLQDIAADLEMPYETVKTYSKLARRSLREEEN
ncbi:MAG: CRISPR-associated endoribonuclease Cas6 [Elainellaceae cyanobacterium]